MRSTLRRSLTAAAVAAAVTAAAFATGPGTAAADPSPLAEPASAALVEVEIPGPEHGVLAGSGHTHIPAAGRDRPAPRLSAAERAADGEVTKVIDNGSTADRLDVVVLGDGYTAAELDRFHTDARDKWAEVAAVEPYTTYQSLFNVWTVDVVSNDSGVTGDPGPATVKDTALGAYFWCGDIERLLCVDQDKVDAYVALAPEADLVIVLANSAKYGGAGYNERSQTLGYEGISTASAGNEKSGQVAIHETGHSLGGLADEYFYPDLPGYEQYTGPESAEPNTSTFDATRMAERRAKWYRWLGEESPDGGKVGVYEGGGYFATGLRRPTDNSLMRVLDKPFNLPGVEAMIAGFYRHARVATAVTPAGTTLRHDQKATVAVPRLTGPDGHQLTVRWYLDRREMPHFEGRTEVRVAELGLRRNDFRTHRLTVTVEDRTAAVRDPDIATTLRSAVDWRVRR
ncbi:M64 family metallopeptidase [Streptomyces sp. TRM49041]|uniref:M64 family metallopeptidase n=1 Tax=Streptomyces sp. TRM49041 TaxID=2603216 RepID=UPI0021CD160D|nr:M64 family metallopeptidase [Streptomyces sp. TRM49041]